MLLRLGFEIRLRFGFGHVQLTGVLPGLRGLCELRRLRRLRGLRGLPDLRGLCGQKEVST